MQGKDDEKVLEDRRRQMLAGAGCELGLFAETFPAWPRVCKIKGSYETFSNKPDNPHKTNQQVILEQWKKTNRVLQSK